VTYDLRVRDQLQTNIVGKKYFLDVNVEHLIMANEHLADKLKNEPADMLPLVTFSGMIV
jgi:DNA replication licensing factor MCM5